MRPRISVIIPVRNGTNYLAEAVTSVHGDEVGAEIIVVDDGSTDRTTELATSLGCRVLHQPPSGAARARNAGISHAQGEYIMFLDHDDVLSQGALDTLLDAIDPDTDIVAGLLEDFISPDLSHAQAARLQPREKAYGGLLTGAYLFRRQTLEALGGFNEELPSGECVDFLLRCREKGARLKQLDTVTCYRRLHLTNTGRHSREAERTGYAASLRARLLGK